jgi:hypothetical protein
MAHKATSRGISYKEFVPTFIKCGISAPKIPEQHGLCWVHKILYIFFFSRTVPHQNEYLISILLIAGTAFQINLKSVSSNPVLP